MAIATVILGSTVQRESIPELEPLQMRSDLYIGEGALPTSSTQALQSRSEAGQHNDSM